MNIKPITESKTEKTPSKADPIDPLPQETPSTRKTARLGFTIGAICFFAYIAFLVFAIQAESRDYDRALATLSVEIRNQCGLPGVKVFDAKITASGSASDAQAAEDLAAETLAICRLKQAGYKEHKRQSPRRQ